MEKPMIRFIYESLLSILLLFPVWSYAQLPDSLWSEVDIDPLISILMPGEPIISDTAGQRVLIVQHDSAVYMAFKLPNPLTDNPIEGLPDLQEYYDGMSQGIIESSRSKLIDDSLFSVGPLVGRYIKYSHAYTGGNPFGVSPQSAPRKVGREVDFRENRLLYLDGKNYMLQYWYAGPESQGDRINGDKFLKSFTLSQPVIQKRQFDTPKKKLSWWWKVVPWILLVLVLAVGWKVFGK